MKKLYTKLEACPIQMIPEGGFLVGSKVDSLTVEVEVDSYIPIEDMKISFD